jgi:hypothetical protein
MDMIAYRANLERLGVGPAHSEPVPQGPAAALLDRMLRVGSTFEVMDSELLWFGPAATVTREVRTEVAQLKSEIIRLLSEGHPSSRRTWGEPTAWDWMDQQEADEEQP